MNMLDDTRTSKISFFVVFMTVLSISFAIVSHFLLAIVVGALLAHLLRPIQNKFVAAKISSKLSAYLLLISLIVIMFVPLFFFIQRLIIETSKFTKFISSSEITFTTIANDIRDWPIINYFTPDAATLEDQLRSTAENIAGTVSNLVLSLIAQIPALFIDTIFILLSFVVFLLHGEKIKDFISSLIPFDEGIKNDLIISSNEISKKAMLASVLAAIGQTVTILVGFLILKVPNAFLASGATFILSFIPFVGSVPIWIAGVIYLVFKGSVVKIICMIIIGIAASLIDNVTRAYVLKSSKDQLHPFLGLISVIGGIQVFGFWGVILGPIVAALLLSMCKLLPNVLRKKEI